MHTDAPQQSDASKGLYAQKADNTAATATVPEDMHGSGHVIADASKDASHITVGVLGDPNVGT